MSAWRRTPPPSIARSPFRGTSSMPLPAPATSAADSPRRSAVPTRTATFIVPRDARGLTIEPMRGALGCRGYMLAKLHLDGCRLPAASLLGRPGFGLTHIAATGLDAGRYNLAWGCVGLAQACLDAAL